MEPYLGLRGGKLSAAIAFVAGLDFTLFGYDQGVTGGLVTLPSFRATFPAIDTIDHPISSAGEAASVQGITVASYTLGCFFGAIMAIWLGNLLGRKRSVLLGTSIIVVGAAIQTASYSLPQLIVARVFTGLGTGINTSTIPTWQSETAKPHHRGRMVMIETSLVVFGVMLADYIDLGFLFLEPSSISWLMIQDHEEEAITFFSALWDLPVDHPRVQDELQAVKHAKEKARDSGFKACFQPNQLRNLHRTLLAYAIMVGQQMTGINIVTYYAATIYETSLGMSPLISRVVAAAGATEYFLANCLSIFLIERLGRRQLLLIGAFGQAIAMAILAGMTSHLDAVTGTVATVFIFLYASFFAIGWGNIPWLYGAELTPLVIRAPSAAIATTGNWLFNFIVVIITPASFHNIGWKTYIIFAVFNILLAPLVYYLYPETAYRSLEEIDEVFQNSRGLRGVFDVVKVAQTLPRRYGKEGELLVIEDHQLRDAAPGDGKIKVPQTSERIEFTKA